MSLNVDKCLNDAVAAGRLTEATARKAREKVGALLAKGLTEAEAVAKAAAELAADAARQQRQAALRVIKARETEGLAASHPDGFLRGVMALFARDFYRGAGNPPEGGERAGRPMDGLPRPVKVPRSAWPEGFPDVVQQGVSDIKRLPGYEAAKAGDADAAMTLVRGLLRPERVDALRRLVGADPAIIVPLRSQEAGRNALAAAYAKHLAQELGIGVAPGIVRVDTARRSGMGAIGRLLTRARFDGDVVAGARYIIADDVVTQGGTAADLRGYIESRGGTVIAVTALQAPGANARLALPAGDLAALRASHGAAEARWKELYGYGFDALTASEARYVRSYRDADAFRDRGIVGLLPEDGGPDGRNPGGGEAADGYGFDAFTASEARFVRRYRDAQSFRNQGIAGVLPEDAPGDAGNPGGGEAAGGRDRGQGYSSVEGRTLAVTAEAHARLSALLDRYRPRKLGWSQDTAGLRRFVRALYGDTADAEASALARAWTETTDSLVARFNRAGGDLANLSAWRLPQLWDRARVKAEGEAGFRGFMQDELARGGLRILDHDTGQPLAGGAALRIIDDAWRRISTNGLSDITPGQPGGRGALANSRTMHRAFEWADADAWFRFNERFGQRDAGIGEYLSAWMGSLTPGFEPALPGPAARLTFVTMAPAMGT